MINWEHRVTPSKITTLEPNQIFGFGSNRGGRHGAGAAKQAMKWGAIMNRIEGIQGQTYAIPTKNAAITQTLPLAEIQKYVNKYIAFAKENPELVFLTTEIGCGLAGCQPSEIAPMFIEAVEVDNIHLPQRFWNCLLPMLEK